MEISSQNTPARQAHRAALVEVENRLSEAFAARTKNGQKFSLESRMLTILTLMVVDLTLTSWFTGESKDYETAIKNVFARLKHLFGEEDAVPMKAAKQRRSVAKRARKVVMS
jgi:hypothetical protein